MAATHEEMRDMYELYALGVLEPEESAEIDRHLADRCEVCQRSVKRAMLTNSVILSFAPDVKPRKELKRKLMSGFGVAPRQWNMLAWAAVAACLLVTTLWLSVEERRRSSDLAAARKQVIEQQTQLSRVQGVVDFLNSPDTRQVNFGQGQTQPPKGNVFVNPNNGVLLIASNLQQLPADKIYQMWVIPKGGAPRPAGLFRAEQGSAVHIQRGRVDLAGTAAVAVTVEPAAGSSTPTMPIIIMAPVPGA
jgi:anti-sigma-K factor RskA